MRNKSFTLIELLITISIIGILAAIILISTSSAVTRASIAKSQVFDDSIRNELMTTLVGEWEFDDLTDTVDTEIADTAGYVLDDWGTNNGTAVGTPTLRNGKNCVKGQCLDFNGETDYIDFGSGSGLHIQDSFTLSAWFYKDSNSGEDFIFNLNGLARIRTVASVLEFRGDVGGNTLTHDITTGKWYNVVGTYEEGTAHLYVDGTLVDTDTITVGSITNFYLGSQGGSLNFFDGSLDNLRIYNLILTTSKIQDEYLAGLESLLVNNQISQEEYNQKINKLSKK